MASSFPSTVSPPYDPIAASTPPADAPAPEVAVPQPFSAEERELMYLYPRAPFPVAVLNVLQEEQLDQVLAWGWFVVDEAGICAPTASFLARYHATRQHALARQG